MTDFTCFLGKVSSWIDLDSDDETLRKDSEIALKQEIAWASHLSLQVNYDFGIYCLFFDNVASFIFLGPFLYFASVQLTEYFLFMHFTITTVLVA